MKKMIIANWKMNPSSIKEANKLFDSLLTIKNNDSKIEVVVAPPFVYLPFISLGSEKTDIKCASQDVFWENPSVGGGAYTGEISPKMLKDLYVDYAIIGHSERRKYIGETDEMINRKVKAALNEGLKVILCVGEPLEVRKKGKKAAMDFVKNQLQKDLKDIKKLSVVGRRSLVIAYEPIWAIGTGVPAHSNDALEMIKYIKQLLAKSYNLKARVLYGGSVNSKNIIDFVKHNEIDGALVGGASINSKEFKKIVEKINKLNN